MHAFDLFQVAINDMFDQQVGVTALMRTHSWLHTRISLDQVWLTCL